MLHRLIAFFISICVAIAPLGSFAHANGHAAHATVLNTLHIDANSTTHDISNKSDHYHSSKPCEGKLNSDGPSCCSIGCTLIMAIGPTLNIPSAHVHTNFDLPLAIQLIGISPAALDPPPKA
jgi:hypothetical protein